MTVYLMAEVKVTDESWIPNYAGNVHNIVKKHGGKYLSRSGNIVTLEGEKNDATLVAIISFPSAQAMENFMNDPDYEPYGNSRRAGSISRLYSIDDTDLAGTIDYLATE